MIYATAGHVDHGKTSLVKALTTVDTDRLAEEKARGLTIDLGFAYFEHGDTRIGFVDVPGHAKFISNMLAGVAAIDHALIVIAADDGPMPQTIEHISILETLGITDATVVLTKIDRVDEQQLQQTRSAITNLLESSPFSKAKIFPTSAIDNSGIEALKTYLLSLGRNLKANKDSHFRLAIDRKFTIKGAGVVVTGSIFSGNIETGAEVYLMPQQRKLRLRSLHRQDTEANFASLGDRCAMNVTGNIDHEEISRGNWITSNPELPVSDKLDCQLNLLRHENLPLRTGTPIHFHLGAQHATGRIFLLEQRHVTPGENAIAQIALTAPVSACMGDRFVIRDQSATRTLGGGEILDPYSVNRGRSKPDRLAFLKLLSNPTQRSDSAGLLEKTATGINLTRYSNALNRPVDTGNISKDTSGIYHHTKHLDDLKRRVIATLKDSKKSLQAIKQTLADNTRSALLSLVLQQLIQDKKITQDGNQFCLPVSNPTLSKPTEALWKKVEPILREKPVQPPVTSDLAKQVNLPPAAVDKLLSECVRQGLLVKPVKNRYFLAEAMKQFRSLAKEVAAQNNGQFTVIQFRDASGLGRNLCIELLEHLDGKGFTKRLNDQRIIQDESR